jgi:hypothetical protein
VSATYTPASTISRAALGRGVADRSALIAVDATSVYWTNQMGGTVTKVGK